MSAEAGAAVHAELIRRRWTLQRLADAAGLSRAAVHAIASGATASLESYARVSNALGLRPELVLVDERRRTTAVRAEDPVHAAMAEREAAHFRALGFGVAIDEPYQHYQFAGRADVLAWDLPNRALLHLENRTRFPNMQEMAGGFTAKCAYLAKVIAERLGVAGGFRSVTHVMVVLWSAEAIHTLKIRTETFRALCPAPPDHFGCWWDGAAVAPGTHRTLVVFDPVETSARRVVFRGLEPLASLRPRYAGYREVVEALERADR